jgi:sulfur carrier protein ThiS
MTIKIKVRDHEYHLEGELSLNKALKRLNIPNNSILAIRNGSLLTEDEILRDNDHIELVTIISGG